MKAQQSTGTARLARNYGSNWALAGSIWGFIFTTPEDGHESHANQPTRVTVLVMRNDQDLAWLILRITSIPSLSRNGPLRSLSVKVQDRLLQRAQPALPYQDRNGSLCRKLSRLKGRTINSYGASWMLRLEEAFIPPLDAIQPVRQALEIVMNAFRERW